MVLLTIYYIQRLYPHVSDLCQSQAMSFRRVFYTEIFENLMSSKTSNDKILRQVYNTPPKSAEKNGSFCRDFVHGYVLSGETNRSETGFSPSTDAAKARTSFPRQVTSFLAK